jgi:hypothetical protein
MQPFVATDEFVAENEAGHEPALLEPKYGAERAREKCAFSCSKMQFFPSKQSKAKAPLLKQVNC